MYYETEKTGMIYALCTGGKEYRKIIPLPKRMRIVVDDSKNFGEITLYDTILEELPEHVIMFCFLLTNSPYARHEGFMVDLGAHLMNFRFSYGYLKQDKNNLVYVTGNFVQKHIPPLLKFNMPQKRVDEDIIFEKRLPDARMFDLLKHTIQIVDFVFNKSIDNRIKVVRTRFNYKEDIGHCDIVSINLKSYFAFVGVLRETNFIGLSECTSWQEKVVGEILEKL